MSTDAELINYDATVCTVRDIEKAFPCNCSGMCRAYDHDLGPNLKARKGLHHNGCPKLTAIGVLEALLSRTP
jgi:hypothetical protein